MSQIRQIYTNLAAKLVAFTDEAGASRSIGAVDLHQLKSSYERPDTPVRLLLPYASPTEARDGRFASLDSIGRQDWYIADLLLWEPVTDGSRLLDYAADLKRYEGAYFEMLRGWRDCGIVGGGSDVELLGWRAVPGEYDWPIGADSWWHGVMVTLQVLEVMTG